MRKMIGKSIRKRGKEQNGRAESKNGHLWKEKCKKKERRHFYKDIHDIRTRYHRGTIFYKDKKSY